MELLASPDQKKRGVNDLGILPKPIPFGKYYLLEKVNTGGMAEVFKAKAFGVEGFERILAVKRILPSIAEDEEFITMFIDEAKIAGQLNHANIAQIFDLGKVEADEDENTPASYFIALEYVSGKDLRAIFDRAVKVGEKLSIAQVCYLIMKCCEGLDYAHNKRDAQGRELGIVHRDVSPQNVLLSHEGETKVIDFGIAKAHGKSSSTQVGILKGKFSYMSPEQVRGGKIDRRSDIFAVGIVLYELLTLERLFLGSSDFSTLEKIRKVEFSPPTLFNPHIPQELEEIVLKALARDPADRYQTAHEMQDALQKFMFNQGLYYTNKDLASYMKSAFAAEISLEQKKLEYYRTLKKEDLERANKRSTKKKKKLSWDEDEGETNVFDRPNISRESKDDILDALDDIELPEDGEVVYSSKSDEGGNGLSEDDLPPPRQHSSPLMAAVINGDIPTEALSALTMPQPPKPSSSRTPWILVVLLLLIGAGAVGAYFYFQGQVPKAGTVTFQVHPEDAAVTLEIDGEIVVSNQLPPISYEISSGESHQYRIIAKGYAEAIGTISVDSGVDKDQAVRLVAEGTAGATGTGFILVTEPTGDVTVTVDGVRMETTQSPFMRNDLMPGEHYIVVSREGFKDSQKTVDIEENQLESVHITLKPSIVTLALDSDPTGASYTLRNTRTKETVKQGKTPDSIAGLSVNGEFEIELEHESAKGKTEKWLPPADASEAELVVKLDGETVAKKSSGNGSSSRKSSGSSSSRKSSDSSSSRKSTQTTTVKKKEEPKKEEPKKEEPKEEKKAPAVPGIVMINSKPPAEIKIKGKSYGTTPQKIDLPPGNYTVVLINKEKGKVEKKVKVEAGQKRKVLHRW